ncbi:MAG: alpha-L-fucosidase [Bacteroidales bacterium]|nr:alpha-L-fucosidase [Bacteroidales bacterium]
MKRNLILIGCMLIFNSLIAQELYTPTPENLEARRWFEQARFGMFIHWGASSVLGHGEWVMNSRNIRVEEYRRLLNFFNPIDFDAAVWVRTAKNAGMKYITFTSRHHDSFSNWDTQQSDWKITNTHFKRDVLKELAQECEKQEMKLSLYYSTLDWFRSDYPYETGRTGKGAGRTQPSDWESYFAFMKAQLTELLTQYGPIACIWLDGHWDQLDNDTDKEANSKIDWHYNELYALIHQLQPHCLIGNNHHLTPFPGEDIQIFEQDLPGENTIGLSGQTVSDRLPLETCATIGSAWGYNMTDRAHKSVKELIHLLVRAAAYNGNLLLNVGPMPNGEIQPEFVSRLEKIGAWMKKYGETIYGTQGGFIKPQEWGGITQKEGKYYIHILSRPQGDALLFNFPTNVREVTVFDTGQKLSWVRTKNGLTVIDLSDCPFQEYDTIIVAK